MYHGNDLRPVLADGIGEFVNAKVTPCGKILSNGELPWTSARPAPKIGVIKGETNIAPMTTAVLLAINPKQAIIAEAISMA